MTAADFLLARIDDRLLHGQVAVAWAAALKPALIYVVDDAVASSAWESALYRSAPPPGAEVAVLRLDAFAALWRERRVDPARSFLLLRSPGSAFRLLDLGVPLARLNVGGLRHREGAREILPYVWVGPEDETSLRALAARGVEIRARDLPMNPEQYLAPLLGA